MKKLFLRVFVMSFVGFSLFFTTMFLVVVPGCMRENHPHADVPVIRDTDDEEFDREKDEPFEQDTLKRLVNKSKRVNFVMMGLAGHLTDTMMFVSFDPVSQNLDLISIPRDTYYPRLGYDGLGEKKINAAHSAHGSDGVKALVSDLLYDVPVDYYITVRYSGAAAIVDAIGGVPVNIPQRMYYEDPYDTPPLVIDFSAGHHVLNGRDAVKFLRYRQAAPGSGALNRNGDLGRIEAQQEFMKNALKQALKIGNLPHLAVSVVNHVSTDVPLTVVRDLADDARSMDPETNVSTYSLPGEARMMGGLSYVFHNALETRQLLITIYSDGAIVFDEEAEEETEEETE